jgi:hypothetical protein
MKVSIWNVLFFIIYCYVLYLNYHYSSQFLNTKHNDDQLVVFMFSQIVFLVLTGLLFYKQLHWLNKKMRKKYKIF